MPLVKCKECRKKISSTALTCPHCGIREPGKYVPCLVTVHRHAFSILAAKIFVDDEYVGEVHDGETTNFEVIPGKRIISLRASLVPSHEYPMTFSEGEERSFEVVNDFWRGGFSLKDR